MDEIELPRNLVEAARAEHRDDWIARLGAQVIELASRWSLRLGAPYQPGGQTAWVAPARSATFGDLVLKVGWRHSEAEHEADGLRAWDGDGAIVVHASDVVDDSVALLLERCSPGTSLGDQPEPEQDLVISGLLRRLWRTDTRVLVSAAAGDVRCVGRRVRTQDE